MRCGDVIECCGSGLFQSALTATFLSTVADRQHGLNRVPSSQSWLIFRRRLQNCSKQKLKGVLRHLSYLSDRSCIQRRADGRLKSAPCTRAIRFAATGNEDGFPLRWRCQAQWRCIAHLVESLRCKVSAHRVVARPLLPHFENQRSAWRSIVASSVDEP